MKMLKVFILLFFANITFAQELGFDRLFSTPLERSELNSSRNRLIQGLDTPEQLEETVEEQTRISTATTLQELLLPRAKYNGLIIRQNGKADYWVNGKSTTDKSNLGKELKSKTHHHGNRLTLEVTEGERINLNPGQVFSFERDRKFEGYEDPHKDEGKLIETAATIKEEITSTPNTLEDLQAKPTEVFDESFLIKEIQKIQLLEQRLQELETGKQTEQ